MKIAFVGAGQMARALAGGFVSGGAVVPEAVMASDPAAAAREAFSAALPGSVTSAENREVAESADIVFLAVKPQQAEAVLADLRGALGERQLVVSIIAGVPLRLIESGLGPGARLVRVMPNTPCLVGASASAYCLGSGTERADEEVVRRLLSAVGIAVRLEEKQFDAVTGLSGSGPAFVDLFVEALADGGVEAGLSREVAMSLAVQTVLGSARLLQETGEHPAVLKDRVASPGGTTIAGIAALESGGFRATVMAAVRAATERCRELAQ